MNRRVILPPGEERCNGSQCACTEPCARKLALPEPGRPLADFSACFILCCAPKWVKRIALCDAVAPVAEPVIKDWIGHG